MVLQSRGDAQRRVSGKALKQFKKANELDNCHFCAIQGMLKVLVLLGKDEKARELYMDRIEGAFSGKPHLMLDEFSSRINALEFMDIFRPRQLIKISHRIIELTVALEESDFFDNVITGFQPSYIQDDLKKCVQLLEDTSKGQDDTVRLEASIKLANAKLLMKDDIDQTIEYHQDLVIQLNGDKQKKDVLFGLGECFIIKGNQKYECKQDLEADLQWNESMKITEALSELDATENLTIQLRADVYLSKAKAFLNRNSGKEQEIDINHAAAEQLKLAILIGSLEACHIYVSKMQDIKEKFLLNCNVPDTLVGIQIVCDTDEPLHTRFTVRDPHGIEIVYSMEAKKRFLQNRVHDVIYHQVKFARDPENEKLSSLYRQVTTMRDRRLQYEKEFIRCQKCDRWDNPFIEKLVHLLEILKEMPDNCISVCQVSIVGLTPTIFTSNYIVICLIV